MQTITDDDLIKFIGRQESQYIIQPSELIDKVKDRMANGSIIKGDRLPWSKTHNCVGLAPGEVSIWAGVNGHGKSQLLGQVCAWGLRDSKWLIASLEMLPEATMERMIKQVAGSSNPPEDYQRDFLNWTDNKLWLYDQTDSVKSDRILGLVHYAGQELGINHIVIDSLMKCGIRKDDLNLQAEFTDRLCWAAKANKIHVHLVHHIRKGDKEGSIPDKFDIRGAAEITDSVDNVFIVHRNKFKETKARNGEPIEPGTPDASLIIAKQRHGGWEGMFKLWFHKDSGQYVTDQNYRTMLIGEL